MSVSVPVWLRCSIPGPCLMSGLIILFILLCLIWRSRYAVKMLKSGPAGGGGRIRENEQPNASPTRQLEHGDSSPSVIRPETQPDSDHQPRCSTPSSPPPWGGTWTTTRRCTTCRCSHTSSRTSSQTSTVSGGGEGEQTISKSIVFLSSRVVCYTSYDLAFSIQESYHGLLKCFR